MVAKRRKLYAEKDEKYAEYSVKLVNYLGKLYGHIAKAYAVSVTAIALTFTVSVNLMNLECRYYSFFRIIAAFAVSCHKTVNAVPRE